jgi:Protein of unknown function (DUF2948)
MSELLKLKAKDAEDIQVISAVLQDSIAPVVDMHYLAEDKNFVMVVQRLCREDYIGGKKERVCCALNLRNVESVQTLGFNPSETDRMLDLLAVMPDGDTLDLIFASDARIRLQLKGWNIMIEDFGERAKTPFS